MRKLLFIVVLAIAVISVIININNDEKEIRVRVVPNSNSSNDLKIKEDVKESVISYLNLVYDNNYDKCESNINDTYKELELDLNNNFDDISVSFDYHTLYNKTYNDNATLNSKELTLYVIIGEGNGDNWWGSIYPEYISGGTEVEYESILVNVINKIKEN